MRDDLLIVDDLMLLLMDDDGASFKGAGTLYHTLGGAVLTELALLGRIQTDGSTPLPVIMAIRGCGMTGYGLASTG